MQVFVLNYMVTFYFLKAEIDHLPHFFNILPAIILSVTVTLENVCGEKKFYFL